VHPPRMFATALFIRVQRTSTVIVAKDGGDAVACQILSALFAFLQKMRDGGGHDEERERMIVLLWVRRDAYLFSPLITNCIIRAKFLQ